MTLDDGTSHDERQAVSEAKATRYTAPLKALTREQLGQMPDYALTPKQLARRLKWRAQRTRYAEKNRERYLRLKQAARERARQRQITGEPAPRKATPEESAAMKAARRARTKAKDPERWRELRAAQKGRAAARRAKRLALLPVPQLEP